MRAHGRVVLFVACTLAAVGGCAQRGDVGEAEVAEANEPTGEPSESDDPPSETSRAGDRFLNAEEQECVADRADEEGLDEETVFTDASAVDDRIAYTDIFLECVPRHEVLAELALGELFRAYASTAAVSEEEQVCVLDYILEESDDPARAMVEPTAADLDLAFVALEECLTESNFDIVTGAPGTGPQAYGDDARLDSMQDDCEDGDARACDLLFLSSPEESDYEAVALTCGGSGASNPDEFCSEEAETDETGYAPADSDGLRVLATECKDGDSTACDLLYMLVPPAHELENVGFTCGGRIALGAVPDCRTELG